MPKDRKPRSPAKPPATCTRKNARQAHSAVAWVGEEPGEDDPLLAFAPFLHKAPRSNSITPDRQRRFVATLAATGIVGKAARSIGKSTEALYRLKHLPGAEGFSAAWDAAVRRGLQRIDDCAIERALTGTRTPIVSGGEILGWWDKPDNTLLRFLLQLLPHPGHGGMRLPRVLAGAGGGGLCGRTGLAVFRHDRTQDADFGRVGKCFLSNAESDP